MSIQRYSFTAQRRLEIHKEDEGDYVLYTDHAAELHHLLSALADIRAELGVGEKPMLSELAGIVRTRESTHATEVERLTGERDYLDKHLADACREVAKFTMKTIAAERKIRRHEKEQKAALERFVLLAVRPDGEQPESLEEVTDILLRRCGNISEENMALRAARDTAVQERDAACKALRWYAETDNWSPRWDGETMQQPAIELDKGYCARAALSKGEE